MKILVNRQVVNGPWGGGNSFLRALFDYAPEFGIQLGTKLNQQYDAIFLMDPRPDELGIGISEVQRYKLFRPSCKVFQRVNECDARKGEKEILDPVLQESSKLNDHTFFVSHWMQSYHLSLGWHCNSFNVIINGVDKNIFKSNLKLDNKKTNIVTHHWSPNPYKGSDVHAWLDDFVGKNSNEFSYTFIGRHQNDFKNTKHIKPLWGQELGAELGKYDVSITGTVLDPSPNHVLETISCGIPTYAHKRGGGATELVGKNHIFDSVEGLETILRSPLSPNNWMPNDWKICIKEYCDKMKEVTNGKL